MHLKKATSPLKSVNPIQSVYCQSGRQTDSKLVNQSVMQSISHNLIIITHSASQSVIQLIYLLVSQTDSYMSQSITTAVSQSVICIQPASESVIQTVSQQ